MKNNQLTFMLAGMLFLCALASAWLVYNYNSSLHKMQELQPKVSSIGATRNILAAVAADAVEYSKKDHSIDQILQTFNLKPGSRPVTPATPARPGK
jgi:hypothetical protein